MSTKSSDRIIVLNDPVNFVDPLGLQGDFSGWGGGFIFGNVSFENYVQNVGKEISAQSTQAAIATYEAGKFVYKAWSGVGAWVVRTAQHGTPIIIYIKVPLGPKPADASEAPSEGHCH